MSVLRRYRPTRAAKAASPIRLHVKALDDRFMPSMDLVANVSGSAAVQNSLPWCVAHANNGDTIQSGPATKNEVYGIVAQAKGDLLSTSVSIASGDLEGNKFKLNPLQGPLQNNGSPTATMPLPPGSPFIGAAATTSLIAGLTVPTTDQRGDPCPANSIAIGAFQTQEQPSPSPLPTSVSLTQVHMASTLFSEAVTLTAQVSTPGGPVNEGAVTFSLADRMVMASVNANGLATAQVNLPALTTSMPLTIGVTYRDGGAVFASSASSGIARFLAVDALISSTTNVSAAGGETNTDLLFDVLSLSRSYDAQGRLREVNYYGIPLERYSYNAQGKLAAIGMLAVPIPLPFGLPPQLADVLFQDSLSPPPAA